MRYNGAAVWVIDDRHRTFRSSSFVVLPRLDNAYTLTWGELCGNYLIQVWLRP